MQYQVKGYGYSVYQGWGDYNIRLGIVFERGVDRKTAVQAVAVLGPSWKVLDLDVSRYGARATFPSDEFTEAKRHLSTYLRPLPCFAFGCKGTVHAIDSCVHSIDYGPAFNVIIPMPDGEEVLNG